jgi:lipoate---protein ligase
MRWKIIDSGTKSAEENMSLDARLLSDLCEPIVHLYDWKESSATYGHFIDISKFFNMKIVKEKKLDLAKRPTGGGIVFHISDLAFSILLPATHPDFSLNSLNNYLYINTKVGEILYQFLKVNIELLPHNNVERSHFCMAKPTIYDLIVDGKKVGGAAQRKTRLGYLHQGTIFLGHPPYHLLEEILEDKNVLIKMKQNSFPLLGENFSQNELFEARNHLKSLFQKIFV